ncbi:PRC-barrel domain-containing protein [Tropicimonas sp. S265A]|uniref:PRC-barrel domain-containing protein n=1 Tax=Tropicimonas sp. S265A TaxID=3415134 RepID=UPI003C7C4EE5
MTRLLRTTALSAALFTAAAAHAEMTADNDMFIPGASETDMHASDFIGMRVYATAPQGDEGWSMMSVQGAQTEWDDVGEINDLVITREGDISSVLVDIGGFLGIGEHHVAMNKDEIRFVSDSETDAPDDFFLVIPASKADLEAAPAYDREWMKRDNREALTDDHMENNPVAYGVPLEAEKVAALTAEDLTGARVYDASGEWIGEVSQLNLSDEGKIDAAIVDVGGFLGLGEKPVELGIDKLDITVSEDGDDYRVSVPMSETELEALPNWEG